MGGDNGKVINLARDQVKKRKRKPGDHINKNCPEKRGKSFTLWAPMFSLTLLPTMGSYTFNLQLLP